MALTILNEAAKLEVEAAQLRIKASVLQIKETQYASRRAANHAIQLHHGSLSIPKHLKADNNDGGRRVTHQCMEDCCPVRISIRQFGNGGQPYWKVYDREGIVEEWNHGFFAIKLHLFLLMSPRCLFAPPSSPRVTSS